MRKQKKTYAPKFYSDLDAPVSAWNKVHESGDVTFLLLKRGIKITKALHKRLIQAWESIYDQYFKEFGISETYASILQKTKEIILLRCEYVETGDRSVLTWIEIAELELKELQEGVGKFDFMQSKIAIEKHLGVYLPLKDLSIREFYHYLKSLK